MAVILRLVVPLVCLLKSNVVAVRRSHRRVRSLASDLHGSSPANGPLVTSSGNSFPEADEREVAISVDLGGAPGLRTGIMQSTPVACVKNPGVADMAAGSALLSMAPTQTACEAQRPERPQDQGPTDTPNGIIRLAGHIPNGLSVGTLQNVEDLVQTLRSRGGDQLLEERRHSKFGHQTAHTYLHAVTDTIIPQLVEELWHLAQRADLSAGWGVAPAATAFANAQRRQSGGLAPVRKPALRCLEVAEYTAQKSPSGHLGWHDDGSTLFTISVLLSVPGRDFEGGAIQVRRRTLTGDLQEETFTQSVGDAVIWRGWEEHRVLPVTRGTRRVLLAEFSLEPTAPNKAQVRPPDSEAVLRYLLLLDPASKSLHKNLGVLLGNQGSTKAALLSYQSALKIDSGYAEAYYHMGVLALGQGEADSALKLFQATLKFDEFHAQARNNLGVLLERQGDIKAAEHCYRTVLLNSPYHAEAHDNLGVLLAGRGQLAGAERSFRAAVSINPKHANGYRNLGFIQKRRGNLVGAEESFQVLVKLQPQSADAHCELARVLLARRKSSDAMLSFETALEIEPSHARALAGMQALDS